MYKVSSANHRLSHVDYFKTRKQSGSLNPTAIVMHYTAGLSFSGDLQILTKSKRQASAHILIGRQEREICQIVPFNKKAWHAGPSKYRGMRGLNSHAVGIEIESIGWLKPTGDPQRPYQDYYENTYSEEDIERRGWELEEHRHPIVGSGTYYWPKYTKWQLDTAEHVCEALIDYYPNIKYMLTHEEIDTRGWKTDPGPAFPMERFRNLLSEKPIHQEDNIYITNVEGLNVRQGPGMGWNVIEVLEKGQHLEMLDENDKWPLVEWWDEGKRRSGHVHERYIEPL